MGQRHQAFVIARIRRKGSTEARYECVSAFHDQWCYGRSPLLAARRMLTLVKQPENQKIIKYELNEVQDKYPAQDDLPALACNFVTFLLGMAWTTEIEDIVDIKGRAFHGCFFEPCISPLYCDNNDGVTVIDITNLNAPRYCFMFLSPIGPGEDAELVKNMTPLTAEQYVREYYSIEQENVKTAIARLDDEPLIKKWMVVEAWPEDYTHRIHYQPEDPEDPGDVQESVITNDGTIPTLAQISLGPAVMHAISSGELSVIRNLLWMPGKAEAIRKILFQQKAFQDEGLQLFIDTLMVDPPGIQLDLVGFSFSSVQISKIVSSLTEIRVLDLSSNTFITIDGVKGVLDMCKGLRRIILCDCPLISDSDIHAFLRSGTLLKTNVDAFIHPYFFRVVPQPLPPIALTVFTDFEKNPIGCSLSYFTPAQIVQALLDMWRLLSTPKQYSYFGQITAHAAFCSAERCDGRTWSERPVSFIPHSDMTTRPVFVIAIHSKTPALTILQLVPSEDDACTLKLHSLRSFLEVISRGRDSASEESIATLEKMICEMDPHTWKGPIEGESEEASEERKQKAIERIFCLSVIKKMRTGNGAVRFDCSA